jgi:hypothetical protein
MTENSQSYVTPDFHATIRIYPTESGGRKSPVFATRFRSWLFSFSDQYWGCFLLLKDIGPLHPGQEYHGVPFQFLFPDHGLNLHIGMKFYLTEGSHRVAEGEIEKLSEPTSK